MSDHIRQAELALLAGRYGKNFTVDSDLSPAKRAVQDVINGEFSKVLTHPLARELLTISKDVSVNQTASGIQVAGGLKSLFAFRITSKSEDIESELFTLAVAVACVHAFLQENWTGPNLDIEPYDILISPQNTSSTPIRSAEELNRLSITELSFGGEPAYHLTKKPAFLRIAQLILDRSFHHLFSVPWWVLRVTSIQQQLLDDPVGLPDSFFSKLDPLVSSLDDNFTGRLLLEQGLLHHTLGSDRAAAQLFVKSARCFGLQYELTGALGKRTKFQENELSQLVLLAESRPRDDDADETNPDLESQASMYPKALPLNDDTLLERTHFTSSSAASSNTNALAHIDPSNQPPLHPIDQCILLSLCLNVRNTQPQHGLTTEEMTPYVDRVILHPRNWSVYTMALLLRSRLESTRSRTVERSTLQLQALVDQMPTADSALSERLLYIHSIPLPSKWEMERELALRFLSLGAVRSAMEIFERLEMWEEVVQCWQVLERPDKGIAIVRDLLEGRKEEVDTVVARSKTTLESKRERMDTAREAKLWCLLGDLEPASCLEHFTKAWEISHHTSGRAARSLGAYYFARGEFSDAIPHLRQAVSINPLISRTWFLLGCSCLREELWVDARDAFARCVAIDEDDAESWNNLASVYLQMGVSGTRLLLEGATSDGKALGDLSEAADLGSGGQLDAANKSNRIPFENKILAFRALKQGLKFSYSNWRMWQNYMIVCIEVGELAEACRAVSRVVEELSDKEGEASVDLEVVERLVSAVLRAPLAEDGPDSKNSAPNPNEGAALLPRVSDLFTRTILPRVSSSPRVFRAYARLLLYQSRWGDALEAHMDAYRCSVGADETVETDVERWREAVGEVQDIIDVLRNIGPRVGKEGDLSDTDPAGKGLNWAFQARSIVRTFMGRTKASFGEEVDWEKLEGALEDLKN